MKRLFYVRFINQVKPARDSVFFENKKEAKAVRDQMNGDGAPKFFVAKGPDHIRYSV